MWASIWKFLRGLFTEDAAGEVACPVRVFGGGGILSAIGYQGYAMIVMHQHFDVQAFGIAVSALIGATGGAIAYKHAKGADTD